MMKKDNTGVLPKVIFFYLCNINIYLISIQTTYLVKQNILFFKKDLFD